MKETSIKKSIINPFTCLSAASIRSRARRGVALGEAWVLPALITVLNLIPARRVTAQTFMSLHNFTATSPNASGVFTNGDGFSPYGGLLLSSNTLYGTAELGGDAGNGTVFAVNTDGSGFRTLHSFTGSDGANPYAGLILSGHTLYGTAEAGGSAGNGTVFAVNSDGTGFTNLYSFTALPPVGTNADGAYPHAGLILSGSTLYGTTALGGSAGWGTVFCLNTNGTGFTTLHSFNYYSDGGYPEAGLIFSGNTLYGTASFGGSAGEGTVFAVNTNGTGFTNLHNFTARNNRTNSDGARPSAELVLSGNTLYGTAYSGGSSGWGTVFAVNTDGTGLATLHSFTHCDGVYPLAGLLLSGNTLYGTASYGGSPGNGTVFAMNTDGTAFANLYSFTGTNSDGASPGARLMLSGNAMFGTARSGGSADYGAVFSLSFKPQLTIVQFGTNVILSWPTNVAGFDYTGYTLQSTTNLVSPAVWTTNSLAPIVIAGQNTVTNPITGPQQFYRLIR